ncbi:MAG TPA: AmmeMemoRadiSam system radical SAM enzyme [Candidatus Hydrogenedentes bacterium]|jgi:pyruvate formate lyase activating enzyme|nr:AmmeMemoRadiSam system radical SAM enzyme [Candidatus Hydrogenedentota bacterium]HPJ97930.1 AmmeMemoRadiSam system radical SAM enzyme [Candidatus Hydrogenedentota bacterium]
MLEARLYEKRDGNQVKCHLCAHGCLIEDGGRGICHVRENRGGTLYSLVYEQVLAENVDPIEKKPLYHVMPGSLSYSIATAGCNFRCGWCQNADISAMPRDQRIIRGVRVSPDRIVQHACEAHCRSIAYTYTEPTVYFEYAYDVAERARTQGLLNVIVTNGFMSAETLEAWHPLLDAANVDLKAFSDATYREHIGGRLQPVLDTLKRMKEYGIWVEVTTLLIPELNDSEDELRQLTAFIARELGRETPWHISRFFPAYRMTDRRPTPPDTLERALQIGEDEGLCHIYLGNIRSGRQSTRCGHCGEMIIERQGYSAIINYAKSGACPACEMPLAGVAIGSG